MFCDNFKKFVEKEQTYENYKFAPTQIIFRNIFRKTSENISETYFQKKRKHSNGEENSEIRAGFGRLISW